MSLGQWLGFSALLASLYILWQLRQVLLLIFAAIVLATALNRLTRKIQARFKLRRTLSLVLSIGIFLGLLGGFFMTIVPPFIVQFQQLTTTEFPAIVKSANLWLTNIQAHLPPALLPYLPDLEDLDRQIQPLLKTLAGRSLNLFSSSLGAILNLLLVTILTVMMLVQPNAYRQAFIAIFPSFYRRRVEEILCKCESSLGKWIAGALLSMVFVAVLSAIGLLALGIPLVLAQSVLAGLLNFIPNVGPTLSVFIPMAIALMDEPWKAVAIFIIYFFIQQIESNLITPYIMAKQVSLLPAVTLIAQVVFTTFFGFLGLLLALPLTVVVKIWVDAVLIEDILDRWHGTSDPSSSQLVLAKPEESIDDSFDDEID
jgi:predicted PurR-regulated permease PerM